jgi:predicted nucleic acid-binding protein
MRLLNTDICIDLLRKHEPTVKWFVALSEPVAVPGLVAMELYQGCHNKAQRRDVDKLLAPLTLIWPTEDACELARSLFADLHLSIGLGLLDALIGCTALGRDAMLCTFNTKHFQGIPGLRLETPFKKP